MRSKDSDDGGLSDYCAANALARWQVRGGRTQRQRGPECQRERAQMVLEPGHEGSVQLQ